MMSDVARAHLACRSPLSSRLSSLFSLLLDWARKVAKALVIKHLDEFIAKEVPPTAPAL